MLIIILYVYSDYYVKILYSMNIPYNIIKFLDVAYCAIILFTRSRRFT